jgi:hypothetical protein
MFPIGRFKGISSFTRRAVPGFRCSALTSAYRRVPECRVAVPRSMKIGVPPWTRGDFRGVLGVTHNLVWGLSIGEPTPSQRAHPTPARISMPPGDATFL